MCAYAGLPPGPDPNGFKNPMPSAGVADGKPSAGVADGKPSAGVADGKPRVRSRYVPHVQSPTFHYGLPASRNPTVEMQDLASLVLAARRHRCTYQRSTCDHPPVASTAPPLSAGFSRLRCFSRGIQSPVFPGLACARDETAAASPGCRPRFAPKRECSHTVDHPPGRSASPSAHVSPSP